MVAGKGRARDCVGTGTEEGCGEQECCIDGDSWLIFETVFFGENLILGFVKMAG